MSTNYSGASGSARGNADASDSRIALGLVGVNLVLLSMLWGDGTISDFFRGSAGFSSVQTLLLLLVGCTAQFFFGVSCILGNRWPGVLAVVLAPVYFGAAALPIALPILGGLFHGRPLRVRGRQCIPALREGSDWTRGAQPDASALDTATREALAALWLHDAQNEHASVPAFSRIAWMLAAVGAPAELMEWAHRSALEEIDHTRLCFALAAGYGGRSYSVAAMPDLLLGGSLDASADPIVTLATESLSDGCQLEGFNADIAHASSLACEEPVTQTALEQFAREEGSHAEFSWALLAWLLEHSPDKVRPAIIRTLSELEAISRPSAVSADQQALVGRADSDVLRRHGRLTDEAVGALWDLRLLRTGERLRALLEPRLAA